MLARKRPASETLLPTRAPKQPRTTTHHPLGGNSSPSQHEALLVRWTKLGMEFMQILRDTVVSLSPFRRGTDEDAPPVSAPSDAHMDARGPNPIPSPPPSPPPPPPRASTSSRQLPPRPAIPVFPPGAHAHRQHTQPSASAPAASNIHHRTQAHQNGHANPQQRPILSTYASMQANAVASTSKTTLPAPEAPKASESSVRSAVTQRYPEVGAALAENAHRRKKPTKQYVEREHIHAKQHKARVREEIKKSREEMETQLYQIKRSSGFQSDWDSFRSFISYQARLEQLDKTGALSPSPSLFDLRARARQEQTRRHSSPDHVDPDFLQRAIRKAQDALAGPKPPQPFVPTLDQLRLSRLAKDEEIEERIRPKRKPLPTSLPPDAEAEVDALFRKRGVISKVAREQVSHEDISRLQPCQWLNDEVINFYGQLILTRAEESKENPGAGGTAGGRKKPLNAHYFSTFFWSKLKGQGYQKGRLSKWTKKIDIFSKDVILIPVNHNNAHWTAAAINFRKKRIESYDSMGMERGLVFKLLRQYLNDEHQDKKKKPFDFTGWENYILPHTPQQENGYDCGVFTCQFLEALSRGEEDFPFSQANMPYLRRKMVWEIGHAKLRDEP